MNGFALIYPFVRLLGPQPAMHECKSIMTDVAGLISVPQVLKGIAKQQLPSHAPESMKRMAALTTSLDID